MEASVAVDVPGPAVAVIRSDVGPWYMWSVSHVRGRSTRGYVRLSKDARGEADAVRVRGTGRANVCFVLVGDSGRK